MSSLPLPAIFCIPLSEHWCARTICMKSIPGSLPDFMKANSGMSYTSIATTKNAKKVPQLDFHSRRLIAGLAVIESTAVLPTHLQLNAAVQESISSIAQLSVLEVDNELNLVIILTCKGRIPSLRIHASLSKSGKSGTSATLDAVVVECRGSPRRHPGVKNTLWFTEREPIEKLRGKANETILVGRDEQSRPVLLEGLITNFFVVTKDLRVWTAGDDLVLSGSVRELVLRVCKELNVPVMHQAIALHDWKTFDSAFLTNVRRLLQPVSIIEIPVCTRAGHSDIPSTICLPQLSSADLVERLRRHVAWIAENTADDI